MPLVVIGARFVVGAKINNRDGGESTIAPQVDPRSIGASDRSNVADRSRRNIIGILVVAADVLVQVEELRWGDRALIQRFQTVLHADIVERSKRESRTRVNAIDVSGNVKDHRACARGVVHRMVAELDGHDSIPNGRVVSGDVIPTWDRVGALCLIGGVDKGLEPLIAANGYLLRLGKSRIDDGEVVRQQMAIEAAIGDFSGVGESGIEERAIDQAWQDISDLQAGVRAARAPRADGEERHAERLDEMLLAHHRTFRRDEWIATIRWILERVDEKRIALGKVPVLQNVDTFGSTLCVPTARAAGAMYCDQAIVPARRRREGGRFRVGGRIEQDRVLIDATIYRSGLDAHDVGDRQAG